MRNATQTFSEDKHHLPKTNICSIGTVKTFHYHFPAEGWRTINSADICWWKMIINSFIGFRMRPPQRTCNYWNKSGGETLFIQYPAAGKQGIQMPNWWGESHIPLRLFHGEKKSWKLDNWVFSVWVTPTEKDNYKTEKFSCFGWMIHFQKSRKMGGRERESAARTQAHPPTNFKHVLNNGSLKL